MIRPIPTFELVGMPGSGKSTLTPLIRSALLESGFKVNGPARLDKGEAETRIKREDRRLWADSRVYLDAVVRVRHEAGHGSPEKLNEVVSELWFSKVYAGRAAQRSRDPVFFEEAMLHELWRMTHLLRGTDEGRRIVRHLWSRVPKTSTVIKLEVSPAVRSRRMRSKNSLGPINRHLAEHSPESEVWVETEKVYDDLVRRATRLRRRLVTLSNDADGDQDAVVERMISVVAGALSGRPAAYRSSSNPSR